MLTRASQQGWRLVAILCRVTYGNRVITFSQKNQRKIEKHRVTWEFYTIPYSWRCGGSSDDLYKNKIIKNSYLETMLMAYFGQRLQNQQLYLSNVLKTLSMAWVFNMLKSITNFNYKIDIDKNKIVKFIEIFYSIYVIQESR